ncbi:MAG: TolC family protein [Elusimicrobia bacterium]|nr:TolC family protein [Elusimicrobiota bacterium]
MSQRGIRFLITIFQLLISVSLYADNWTAESYIKSVFTVSNEIKRYEEDALIYKNEYISSLANAFLPAVSIKVSQSPYSNSNEPRWNFSRDNTSAATNVSMNLFNGWKDRFDIDKSRINRKMAEKKLWLEKQNMALTSLKTYYRALGKKRLLEVVKTSLKSYEEQYYKVKDYYKNGMKSLSDLLKSELNLRTSQLQEVTAVEGYKNSVMDFNLTLRRQPEIEVELQDADENADRMGPSLEQDIQSALKNRPELELAGIELEKNRISMRKSRINSYPDFSIDASWNRQGIGSIGRPAEGTANPTYSIAMTFSVPIGPQTISDRNSVVQAEIELERAKRTLREKELEVRREVISRYFAFLTVAKRHEVSKMKSRISKQNLEIVQEQYNQGRAGIIELAEAQKDDLESQSELADALYNLVIAEAEYKKALGIRLW